MINQLPKAYRKYYLIGFVILLITAIFSVGHHSFDEHFQILEFCGYKMGHSPIEELPWEFQAQIRPALQPFIAFCFAQLLTTLGVYDPFTLALLLRLLMALFSWYVICRLSIQLLPQFKSEQGRKLYVLCSIFLWFVPYLGVRFSAESFSAALFFLALALLLELKNNAGKYPTGKLLFAGMLLGFSLFTRLQLAGAILGLAVWLLLQRWSIKHWLYIFIGGVIATGLCILCDYWLYGQWLITPYKYFDINILQQKAAEFGVLPWWYYFVLFIQGAVPPLSIVLLLYFFAGLAKKPLHMFSLVCISFLIMYFAIGHKEIRFLFPMAHALIFISCIGIDHYLPNFKSRRVLNITYQIFIFINCSVLIFRVCAPAEIRVSYYKYIYDSYKRHPNTILVAYRESPYGVPVNNFFKPQDMSSYTVEDAEELEKLRLDNADKNILFISPTLTPPQEFSTYNMQLKFSIFPQWILKYNINNWQDRTDLWAIYKLN